MVSGPDFSKCVLAAALSLAKETFIHSSLQFGINEQTVRYSATCESPSMHAAATTIQIGTSQILFLVVEMQSANAATRSSIDQHEWWIRNNPATSTSLV